MNFLSEKKITVLKGIGEKKALAFEKLGVCSLYDLLCYYPRKYEDRSVYTSLSDVKDGVYASIRATVADNPKLNRIRKGMELVKFRIVDESGLADVTFFNQSYVKNIFEKGETYDFYGKFSVSGRKIALTNPVFELAGKREKCGRLTPIYGLVSGLNQKTVTEAIRSCYEYYGESLQDVLPRELLEKYCLDTAKDAVRKIHFPDSYEELADAHKRILFEDVFVFCSALEKLRGPRESVPGVVIEDKYVSDFISSLPFSPTGAQRRTISECLNDMSSGTVMNRLVQGDVGSGKTLVAAALIYSVIKSGYSAAFMAPTEILAQQHYETFQNFFRNTEIRTELLTGSTNAKEREQIIHRLASRQTDLLIGTHALFGSDVVFSNLALVVTDEQHRFGVNQRSALIEKGVHPHVLVMSATPIPRTLALILYGDLDISVIDELPPGRQVVETFAVDNSYHERIIAFIKKQVDSGHQTFIVCPKVEDEDDTSDLKSAVEYTKQLSSELPGVSVGCVHGKMRPSEKADVMEHFSKGNISVLVATTVIEVGVDVPNATLMIIEDADRFGLSQLHQLRGRVGRGSDKSYCILVSDSDSENSLNRLKALCKTNDGFRIAEEDLKMRGPGDFLGTRQHGLPEIEIGGNAEDMELMQQAHDEACNVILSDPGLSDKEHIILRDRIERFAALSSSSFN